MIDTQKKPPSPDELFYIETRARDCARLPEYTEADCPCGTEDPVRRARWLKAFRAERRRSGR